MSQRECVRECAWLCLYAQIHLIDTTRTDFARHHSCFLEIKKGCAGKMHRLQVEKCTAPVVRAKTQISGLKFKYSALKRQDIQIFVTRFQINTKLNAKFVRGKLPRQFFHLSSLLSCRMTPLFCRSIIL